MEKIYIGNMVLIISLGSIIEEETLPKWPQWPKLGQSEAGSYFGVSCAGTQALGSSYVCQVHQQGAAWEVE